MQQQIDEQAHTGPPDEEESKPKERHRRGMII